MFIEDDWAFFLNFCYFLYWNYALTIAYHLKVNDDCIGLDYAVKVKFYFIAYSLRKISQSLTTKIKIDLSIFFYWKNGTKFVNGYKQSNDSTF